MKGVTITYGLKQEELIKIDKVKKLITNQTINHPLGIPQYYAVLYYGKSFDGEQLHSEQYRKRWDRNEVRRTHKFISKFIHKCFGDEVPLWWFINRHEDYEDEEGNIKKGSFHSDLYIGEIKDEVIEDPKPQLMPLFYALDNSGFPIDSRPVGIEGKKLLLLEACIRQSKWVGKNPNSLKVSLVPPEEVEQTLHYGLKDLTSLDELEKVVDWENSNFYTPNKEN